MEHCCDHKAEALTVLRDRQKGVLQLVLAINAVMFVAEGTAGVLAHSTVLLADSLDMLGDAFVYGLSLYALHRSAGWRAGAALTKGMIMAAFGVGVVIEAVLKLAAGVVPEGSLMGVFGMLALAANVSCLALLMRHRSDDLNMRSTWVCSRNDVMANGGVLLAAAGVAITGTAWPDILIGLLIAALFLFSAWGVIRASLSELRTVDLPPYQPPVFPTRPCVEVGYGVDDLPGQELAAAEGVGHNGDAVTRPLEVADDEAGVARVAAAVPKPGGLRSIGEEPAEPGARSPGSASPSAPIIIVVHNYRARRLV